MIFTTTGTRILTTLLFGLTLVTASGSALAERSVVILSQQCDYVLLNSSGRQVLVKLLNGQSPETGDILSGPLNAKDFSDLTNHRSKESMNVWVDMIDGNNRALSRYTQYCG